MRIGRFLNRFGFVVLFFMPFLLVIIIERLAPDQGYPKEVLSLNLGAYPRTFNPFKIVDASSAQILNLQYQGLTQPSHKKKEVIGNLAKKWTINRSSTHYIFYLKKGLFWSDGHPITADDVVFTYNQILLNKDKPHSFSSYFDFADNALTVLKINSYQVEFIFKKPFIFFLNYTFMPIVPKHIWSHLISLQPQELEKLLHTSHPVVSGPYQVSQVTQNKRITLIRNLHYQVSDASKQKRKFSKIIFSVISNDFSAFFLFLKKKIHMVALSAQNYLFLKNQKNPELALSNQTPQNQILLWGFCLKELHNDFQRELRSLLSVIINKDQIVDAVFLGEAEKKDEGLTREETSISFERQQYLVLKLKKKFPDQFPLTISVLIPMEASLLIQVAEIIQQQLAPFDIHLRLHLVPFSHLVQTILNKDSWDSVMIGLSLTQDLYLQKALWIQSGALCFWNKSPQDIFKDTFIRLEKIKTLHEQEKIEKKFYSIFHHHTPFIYLCSPHSMVSLQNRIKGHSFSIYQPLFHNIGEWYYVE